ncbi:MAG: PhzF family phenazine biosynthesis protein [Acidobacteriota bacterium]|jgi:predicted PhzF superfamily epimerase YddE/YHI9
MRLPIYQVDAFADEVFHGNPAAVVLLDRELPAATLQGIAAENNLSETAFVQAANDRFNLRWFTPTTEVDLCGHATLATAHVLFELGKVEGGRVRFATASGELAVMKSSEGYTLDFPSRPPDLVDVSDELIAALGKEPRETLLARDLLAVFDTEDEVRTLEPKMEGIAALDIFAIIVTAPGHEVDFVSRFFAPAHGVPEDPVTGSAHCTLTPYWAERLGKTKLRARQLSRRGGELICEQRGQRVFITGQAVGYLEGMIDI